MTRKPDPKRPDRRFETSIQIRAAREHVWQALTEAREIARWFAPDTEAEPRAGGRMVWKWGDAHTWTQTIEAFEPGRHLRTRYDSGVADGQGGMRPLFVDFHLEGDRGVTTLRVTHSGFGPESGFDGEFDGISNGWPVELRSLRLYLEQHRGTDRTLVWALRRTKAPQEQVWARLVGPDGLAAPDLTAVREGERFAIVVPGAGALSGTALLSRPGREFSGIADDFGNAWLRIDCERHGDSTHVWLWLASYGQPEAKVKTFRAAFERLLDRVVEASAPPATPAARRAAPAPLTAEWRALLERTPAMLDAWLRTLPAMWLECDEGPSTWCALQVLGHLIEGERSDWLPRVRHLLEHGEGKAFPPFDREAGMRRGPRTVGALLDEFAAARRQSMRELDDLRLRAADLDRKGRHPEFGAVTLGQHLATWAAHDLTHILQIARAMGRSLEGAVGPWRAYLRVVREP